MVDDLDSPHLPDLDELRKQVEEIQKAEDKYVYFLLAIAAAAIAYAMQRTSNSVLAPIDCVLGLAVLCWAGSFWAGCQNREGRLMNAQMHFWSDALKIAFKGDVAKNPTNPHLPKGKALASNMLQNFDKMGSTASSSAQNWFGMQFRLLVAGAVFCFLWHVIGMALLTPESFDEAKGQQSRPGTVGHGDR